MYNVILYNQIKHNYTYLYTMQTDFISCNDDKNPKFYYYFSEEKSMNLTLLMCSANSVLMFMFMITGLVVITLD